jgi:hypothetical protein
MVSYPILRPARRELKMVREFFWHRTAGIISRIRSLWVEKRKYEGIGVDYDR